MAETPKLNAFEMASASKAADIILARVIERIRSLLVMAEGMAKEGGGEGKSVTAVLILTIQLGSIGSSAMDELRRFAPEVFRNLPQTAGGL